MDVYCVIDAQYRTHVNTTAILFSLQPFIILSCEKAASSAEHYVINFHYRRNACLDPEKEFLTVTIKALLFNWPSF